jgi:NAD(P)-dependent dehydrogenase (short-subunit alcohol dehydrogenase family)
MSKGQDGPRGLAVVTGGTSGIGLATARGLAERGFRLVLVGRDRGRGERAVQERSYRGLTVHARAKLVQALVARELAGRLDGTGVSVVLVNPGAAWTAQTASMTPRMVPPVMGLWWPLMRRVQHRRTPGQAATAVLVAATGSTPDGGTPVWIDEKGQPGEPGRRARDDAAAAQLYERVQGLLRSGVD